MLETLPFETVVLWAKGGEWPTTSRRLSGSSKKQCKGSTYEGSFLGCSCLAIETAETANVTDDSVEQASVRFPSRASPR